MPIIALAMLVVPVNAEAATRFVSLGGSDTANNCLSAASPCRHVAYAATQAANGDTVSIGPGLFSNENVSITTAKRVDFVGSGASFDPSAGTTVQSGSAAAAFSLQGGGGISALRVAETTGSANAGSVHLEGAGPGGVKRSFMLSDVILENSLSALDVDPGASGLVDVDVSNTRFIGPSGDFYLLDVRGPGVSVAIRDSSFEDPGNDGAMATEAGAALTFERVTGRDRYGVSAYGGSFKASRSRLTTTSGWTLYIESNTPAGGATNVEVSDSVLELVRTSPFGSFPNATIEQSTINNGLPSSLSLVGSTVVERAPGVTEAIKVQTEAAADTATASLLNTVARAINTGVPPAAVDIRALGPGTSSVSASFSAFNSTAGNVTPPSAASNVSTDPQFANEPGGDYTLKVGSPLVDRGSPATATPGALDLAGNPRSLDGDGDCAAVPDIGALERPDACPDAAPILSAASLSRKRFAVGGANAAAISKRKQAPRGTRIRTTVSEASNLTFSVERRLNGRRVGRSCLPATKKRRQRPPCPRYVRKGAFTTKVQAGANSTPWSGRLRKGRRLVALRPGRYRLRVQAIDSAGQHSAERRLVFRIVKR